MKLPRPTVGMLERDDTQSGLIQRFPPRHEFVPLCLHEAEVNGAMIGTDGRSHHGIANDTGTERQRLLGSPPHLATEIRGEGHIGSGRVLSALHRANLARCIRAGARPDF